MSRSYSSDRYSVCGKRPLAIVVMSAELPPFKNGEHDSESTSTIDRVITSLTFYNEKGLKGSAVCFGSEQLSYAG